MLNTSSNLYQSISLIKVNVKNNNDNNNSNNKYNSNNSYNTKTN